ncbi:MAG: PilZ domain-containing protein [Planctomycetota bacterium]
MTGASPENRGATRISERCQISYRSVDDADNNPKRIATQTLNLSSSGLCLVAPEALIPDRHLALELEITERKEPLVAIGRVVWCDRDGDNYRVGVCFTWLREEDRKDLGKIADYVAGKLSGPNG